ncbi:unnamed protein product [Moneuplotes crassus]|uniref:Uncharacterized protein n=1 Tax=Euplotes crassus TaxID=5936 RepID=A0AAD1UJP6_EUPCR|nr:unnamed protein product [Moneuplotes crassus]
MEANQDSQNDIDQCKETDRIVEDDSMYQSCAELNVVSVDKLESIEDSSENLDSKLENFEIIAEQIEILVKLYLKPIIQTTFPNRYNNLYELCVELIDGINSTDWTPAIPHNSSIPGRLSKLKLDFTDLISKCLTNSSSNSSPNLHPPIPSLLLKKEDFDWLKSDIEHCLLKRVDRIDMKLCSDFYGNSKGAGSMTEESNLTSDNGLNLWLNEPKDLGFLKKIRNLSLPNLEKFSLCITTRHKKITKILDHSLFSKRIECLSFDCIGLTPIWPYLTHIISKSHKVTGIIELWDFEISELQIKKIFRAYRHLTDLAFMSCKLHFPRVPDFSKALEETCIENLNLWDCENIERSNWESWPERFNNFICGLSQSDLKHSLQEVDFGENSCFERRFVSETFGRFGLSHVVITGNFIDDNSAISTCSD